MLRWSRWTKAHVKNRCRHQVYLGAGDFACLDTLSPEAADVLIETEPHPNPISGARNIPKGTFTTGAHCGHKAREETCSFDPQEGVGGTVDPIT